MPNGARPGAGEALTSSAVVAAGSKRAQPPIFKQIADSERAVERALPVHLKANAPSFVRSLLTVVRQTPDLVKCEETTVLGGLIIGAQLGLQFGPLGHCYLVPFENRRAHRWEAQFILGYKGKIDLAWRSGQLASIGAREVREGDHFEFDYGVADKLEHRPLLNGERGAPYAWFCLAKFRNGGHYFVVLDRQDVDRHRKSSRSANSEYSPWSTSFSQMAMKSAVHEAGPYLPLTTEAASDFAQDGVVARGTDKDDLDVDEGDWIETTAAPAADRATGEIAGAQGTLDAEQRA